MSNKEHKIKYGLKIWSVDQDQLFKEAAQLFSKGEIDFMEIYIVPDSITPEKYDVLKNLNNIPITIHAPHIAHGFDVFRLNNQKIKLFKEQIIKIADSFNSKFIVVHAESGDSFEVFKESIDKIRDKRILIENMPKFGIDNEICFGHSYEQLKLIKDSGINLCLDFGHAIRSAISQKLDYKEFIKKIISELNPSYFHICNGKMDAKEDHRSLFDGEFDIKWLKKTLFKLKEEKDVYLVFETPKGGNGLENDLKNINYFRSI